MQDARVQRCLVMGRLLVSSDNKKEVKKVFHWINKWSKTMREPTHYSQERFIIHSDALLEASGLMTLLFAPSAVQLWRIRHVGEWACRVSKGQLEIQQQTDVHDDGQSPWPLHPPLCCLSFHKRVIKSSRLAASTVPTQPLLPGLSFIILKMSRYALFLHNIYNTFDGGQCLVIWPTIHDEWPSSSDCLAISNKLFC